MSSDIEFGEDGQPIYLIGWLVQSLANGIILKMGEQSFPLHDDDCLVPLLDKQIVLEGEWDSSKIRISTPPTALQPAPKKVTEENPSLESTVTNLLGDLINNMTMPGSLRKICKSCQTTIPDESKFCMECGVKQE